MILNGTVSEWKSDFVTDPKKFYEQNSIYDNILHVKPCKKSFNNDRDIIKHDLKCIAGAFLILFVVDTGVPCFIVYVIYVNNSRLWKKFMSFAAANLNWTDNLVSIHLHCKFLIDLWPSLMSYNTRPKLKIMKLKVIAQVCLNKMNFKMTERQIHNVWCQKKLSNKNKVLIYSFYRATLIFFKWKNLFYSLMGMNSYDKMLLNH